MTDDDIEAWERQQDFLLESMDFASHVVNDALNDMGSPVATELVEIPLPDGYRWFAQFHTDGKARTVELLTDDR